MTVNYVEDAEKFVEEARETDFSRMTKREVQKWMFRVKRKMSGRYEIESEGFEEDYEMWMSSEDGVAEFVVDRRKTEEDKGVEINAHVVEDRETKFREIWEE